jgi:hypothetical protein
MAKKKRPPRPAPVQDVPVVGPREPCPCGSGKRYKVCHGKAAARARTPVVERPFKGLADETEWVALREFVPSATAPVTLAGDAAGDHRGARVLVASVLPGAVPALRRDDGAVLLALQTTTSSGDPSRDLAAAMLAALDQDGGAAVSLPGLPGPGPRLQDLLDPQQRLTVTLHEEFDFWVGETDDEAINAVMEQANSSIIPTQRLASVTSAYVATMGDRRYLRWVQPHDEDALLDALARLRASGEDALGDRTTLLGAFRAHGLLIPVWELDSDVLVDDLEDPAVEMAQRLADEVADRSPLDAGARRSRAALANRQITLR